MRVLAFIVSFSLLAGAVSAKVKVVATIQPLALLVKDVGGDRVDVYTLLPVGVSVHVWEMRYGDIKRIMDADLVVAAGCGAEPWLRVKPRRIWYLCEGLKLLNGNPHVWISLDLSAARLDDLVKVLSQLDPEGAPVFHKRAALLKDKLVELKKKYERLLSQLTVVSQHGAWVYLMKDLKVDYVGALEPAPHREPGPGRVMGFVKTLKRSSCPVVLEEVGHNPALAELLAKRAGACVAKVYPLGKRGLKSFVDFLKVNLDALLRCKELCTR